MSKNNNYGLTPIGPVGPLAPFGDFFRGLFDDDMFELMPRPRHASQMLSALSNVRSDIKETDTSYVVEAELPGFKKEDIKLDMTDGILTITAETSSEKEEENKDNYVHKERYCGRMMRQYAFKDVDADAITAKYNNGILEVELPKKEPTKTKNEIKID